MEECDVVFNGSSKFPQKKESYPEGSPDKVLELPNSKVLHYHHPWKL